ncbi:DUF4259 domain-containing protein [Streptomyces mirabilis]|uniref:DUF4259 domain-containing protein n=1 Tax=Streptomyces mirabilis TaxID=68239 RepID=UPI0034E95B96
MVLGASAGGSGCLLISATTARQPANLRLLKCPPGRQTSGSLCPHWTASSGSPTPCSVVCTPPPIAFRYRPHSFPRAPSGKSPDALWNPGTGVGIWGYKPFENDTAADSSGDLDEAPESERLELLRAALSAVVESDGHAGRSGVAIAAAAVVAPEVERVG